MATFLSNKPQRNLTVDRRVFGEDTKAIIAEFNKVLVA